MHIIRPPPPDNVYISFLLFVVSDPLHEMKVLAFSPSPFGPWRFHGCSTRDRMLFPKRIHTLRVFLCANVYWTMTSGYQGTPFFRRYDQKLVLKPAISLNKSWGGYRRVTIPRPSICVDGKIPSCTLSTVLLVYLKNYCGVFCSSDICTLSTCFTNFASASHSSPAYSCPGTIPFVTIQVVILVSRSESLPGRHTSSLFVIYPFKTLTLFVWHMSSLSKY